MKEVVCVTGGSGGIGQALLEHLVDRYVVKALFRAKTDVTDKWIKRGCVPVWGHMTDDAALSELVTGSTFVFHCAAVTQGSYEQAYAVNVDGTRRIARLAAAHGCRRFVHVSSIAVYSGAQGTVEYVEDAELSERDDMAVYSLTKLQSERALEEVSRECGLEYTILRPTSVYGPHTKPHTLIPITLIRKGLPVVVGDGRGVHDVVYVDDVAKAMLLAAQSPGAAGEVFNVGHETVTFNDFYARYCRMLNRPARHVPISLLTMAANLLRLLPGARKAQFRELEKGVRFLIAMARNTSRFPSAKAKALLGYAPEFGLAAGMLQTELWLKHHAIIPPKKYSLDEYGPLPFVPVAAVHPVTEEEIIQIVRIAQRFGVKARAIGSLHSTCAIPYTDGVCIVLDKYNKILKVEGPLVTVQAGMKLCDLNDALAELNLALPTNGSITAQTVSGAISTATHGGSMFYGSLSDYVDRVQIVRADGSICALDRSQDGFDAVVVSFGILGVISTVTFRCVPSFVLQSRRSVRKASEVLDQFDQINRSSLYTNMFYFPVTDDMEILAIDNVDDENTGGLSPAAHVRVATTKPSFVGTRQRLARAGLKTFVWLLLRHTAIQKFFTKSSVGTVYKPCKGRSDRVLAISDVGTAGRSPAMLQDMEIAVAYEDAPTALKALRQHFLTTRKYPLMPIHIRCATRSDMWMSPAYKRDVCWFEFWQYPASDTLFSDMHRLFEPFGYRFHWGKETRAGREYTKQQYERWDDFARLRREWDPEGTFLNRYLEPFFCEEQDRRVNGAS